MAHRRESKRARPTVRPLAATLAALLAATVLLASSDARAEEIHMPRVGQNYLAVGLSLQPGFVYDDSIPEARSWKSIATSGGGSIRGGFHQIMSRSFIMSAEADIGLQWLNEHTLQTQGRADSELAFGWQLALKARWLPFGERAGWSLGGGPQFYTAYLNDRPLHSLGLGVNLGKFIWQGDEDFLLLEFGYEVPFIQGLRQSSSFTTPGDSRAVKDWTFHRFSLSLQYGF